MTMDLQKLGLLMSGIASATSRQPGYLQQNLIMQDAFQEMKDREAAQQADQEQRAMLAKLASPQFVGTPMTKQFNVNGKTVGQNAPAQMMQTTPDAQLRALSQMPGFREAALSKLLSERFAGPAKPMALGAKDRLIDPNTLETLVDVTPETAQPKLETIFDAQGREIKVLMQPDGSYKPVGSAKATETAGAQPPSGYRWKDGKVGGDLEAIKGGPADIGQKGLPQSYKDATAAMDAYEKVLGDFETLFDKAGTEVFNTENKGKLSSQYAQLLFLTKGLEQTGALDKGSVDVIKQLLDDPTSWGAAFTPGFNSKLKGQISSVKDYIKERRRALDDAFAGGAPSGQPRGTTGAWKDGETRTIGGAKVTRLGGL